MRHSFISWDSSYRNFHHLIDSFLAQDADRAEFELIYVEQRTKRFANSRNRALGLPSLWARYEEVKDRLNIQVIYVGDRKDQPYHLSRCVNAGLEAAQGKIVSVMDGDQLLRPEFVKVLTAYHNQGPGVACIACHVASGPAGTTPDEWLKASFEFDQVLALCPYGDRPYPEVTQPGSYGALVSAPAAAWTSVGGFDEHPIWATSASTVISDAAHRLERFLGVEAQVLLDTYSLHPWHPHGYGRAGRAKDQDVQRYLELQQELMRVTSHPDWRRRTPMADAVYARNQKLVDKVHQVELERLYG